MIKCILFDVSKKINKSFINLLKIDSFFKCNMKQTGENLIQFNMILYK
jgi:hypothetical protein